jgi:cytochrome c-type protein NapB
MSPATGRARRWLLATCAAAIAAAGCGDRGVVPVPDREGAFKSVAAVRADRRAYDGAPPIIPHRPFGAACGACHHRRGQSVPDVGFAPASPHAGTRYDGGTTRCRQCHVFRTTDELYVASVFAGLRQDLSAGDRASGGAPPRIPHRILMRENCGSCHDGPAAREEIRTSHPERTRCRQCHVPVAGTGTFSSEPAGG